MFKSAYNWLLVMLFERKEMGYSRYMLHENILLLDMLTKKKLTIKQFKNTHGKKRFWYMISKRGVKYVKQHYKNSILSSAAIRDNEMDMITECGIEVGLNGY